MQSPCRDFVGLSRHLSTNPDLTCGNKRIAHRTIPTRRTRPSAWSAARARSTEYASSEKTSMRFLFFRRFLPIDCRDTYQTAQAFARGQKSFSAQASASPDARPGERLLRGRGGAVLGVGAAAAAR